MDVIDAALRSTISRVVAALTPVIAAALGALFYWLQDAVGIDLQVDPAVAAAYVGTVVLGFAFMGLKWLEGRAAFERAALAVKEAERLGSDFTEGEIGSSTMGARDPADPSGPRGPLE
jgi:hypothetical protein